MSEQPVVLGERRGATFLITLNRPEVQNAINIEVAPALGGLLTEAEQDPDVRAIVIAGTGGAGSK
jgi:crotonobetainyl-CoA hydratase